MSIQPSTNSVVEENVVEENVFEAVRKQQVRKAAIASVIGTSIEWYDFFLYGTMSALVFQNLFFKKSDPYIAILLSFSVLFIGFLARPIGAMIFGYYGDRIGRKATLVSTLLLMGISSTLIGLLPTYESIGTTAAVLLVLLRFLQGIGVGGEWGGSVVLSTEWASKKNRGLMGSMTQLGSPIGIVASILSVSLCVRLFGDNFNTWGWRIPFLVSIILIGIGLYIRVGIKESPQFTKMKKEQTLVKNPLWEVLKKHPKEIFWATLSGLVSQVPLYIFSTFIIFYGTEHLKMDKQFLLSAILIFPAIAALTIPLFAYLSDKMNRKKITIAGCIVTMLTAFPCFLLINTTTPSLVILSLGLAAIGPIMSYAPQAALIAENFPTHLRYSGSSLGYNFSAIIGGGLAPIISVYLLQKYGSTTPISVYLIVVSIISIVGISKLKDLTNQELEETLN